MAILPILIGFWFFIKKVTSYKGEDQVKISFKTNFANEKVWFRIFGLMLMTMSLITIFSVLSRGMPEKQIAVFKVFKQFDPIVALPLLFGFALAAGVVEEVLYRGVFQNITVKAYPKVIAFSLIAIMFALFHQLPLSLILPYALVSIGYSLVADEYKSLGVVIIAHVLVDVLSLFIGYYTDFDNSINDLYVAVPALLISITLLFYRRDIRSLFRSNKLSLSNR